jgi:hypothetical protein
MTNLRIESIAIAQLQHDPQNARKHNHKNIEAIANSLKKFGQRKPIVVAGENVVVAGNGQLEAARSLGWTEIQVARVPNEWSWEQVRAFALADNRTAEMAEWDSKVLVDQLVELDAVGWELSDFGFEELMPAGDVVNSIDGESNGLGNPIVSYQIIFENELQQEVWYQYLRQLKLKYPEVQTGAGRLIADIEDKLDKED